MVANDYIFFDSMPNETSYWIFVSNKQIKKVFKIIIIEFKDIAKDKNDIKFNIKRGK
jgi:hypothetical protein